FANSAGAFIGPSIGGYMQDVLGVNKGFLGAAALSLISMMVAGLLPMLKGEKALVRTTIGDIIKQPVVISNLLLSGAVFFASDIINTYLPLYGAEIGLTVTAIGFVLSANGMAQMLIRPFLGHVCALMTKNRTFRLCLLMGGIGTVCLGLMKSFYPLMLVAIFIGFTLGLANPLTLITVSDVSLPENRNRVLALRLMSNYAGQTISPITFGALAKIAGLGSVFWGSGGVMLVCFYAANLINKKT
ncbi:MAG: MFS transporter, partial [Bacteroidota bacterium]